MGGFKGEAKRNATTDPCLAKEGIGSFHGALRFSAWFSACISAGCVQDSDGYLMRGQARAPAGARIEGNQLWAPCVPPLRACMAMVRDLDPQKTGHCPQQGKVGDLTCKMDSTPTMHGEALRLRQTSRLQRCSAAPRGSRNSCRLVGSLLGALRRV